MKDEHDKPYEVYVVSYKGLVLYVGEGKRNRHLHATSGISHVYDLNRYHFTKKVANVEVTGVDSKEEAVRQEVILIEELKPLYNKTTSVERKKMNDFLLPYKDSLTKKQYRALEFIRRSVGISYIVHMKPSEFEKGSGYDSHYLNKLLHKKEAHEVFYKFIKVERFEYYEGFNPYVIT